VVKVQSGIQKLMLLSGGTGGHVFPALALATEFVRQGHDVSFMTDRRGMKYLKDLDPRISVKVLPLSSKPPQFITQPLFLFQLFSCFFLAIGFILKKNPRKIIGYGGYPVLPGLCAGLLLGKQLYASEQDAVLGSVNKLFARVFKRIFLSTPLFEALPQNIACKTLVTGLPVRASIERLHQHLYHIPLSEGPIHLAIIGGSQGASIFSEVIPQALMLLPESVRGRLKINQQCRAADVDKVNLFYKKANIQATVSDFFATMDQILEQAHLLFTRSGASSVAEIIMASVPAIFVPYPYATRDHQTANARLITDQGAGWLIRQPEFTAEKCNLMIQDLLSHPYKLLFASERLTIFSKKNITRTLASEILNV